MAVVLVAMADSVAIDAPQHSLRLMTTALFAPCHHPCMGLLHCCCCPESSVCRFWHCCCCCCCCWQSSRVCHRLHSPTSAFECVPFVGCILCLLCLWCHCDKNAKFLLASNMHFPIFSSFSHFPFVVPIPRTSVGTGDVRASPVAFGTHPARPTGANVQDELANRTTRRIVDSGMTRASRAKQPMEFNI